MEEIEKKKSIPRGPAATAAKNKYRDKTYDRMELTVPRGMKEKIKKVCKELDYPSQNSFAVDAMKEKYEKETGRKWE